MLSLVSSGFLWVRHPKEWVEPFLGCSPPLSPAPCGWPPGSATPLKWCMRVTTSCLSTNEWHQWPAGYRPGLTVLLSESGRLFIDLRAQLHLSALLIKSCFLFHLLVAKWRLKLILTSRLCSWWFKAKIYMKMMRVTKFVPDLVFDPSWHIKTCISLLLRDFCFLIPQVTLTEEVRILYFIALYSSLQ